ncbi:MAG: transglutaminase-like domain-containing protein [Peptostreptococcaceae bacterium]|nr:transglutaminase-like domain-containing protein [Peptostreptococcaceae bacterium]
MKRRVRERRRSLALMLALMLAAGFLLPVFANGETLGGVSSQEGAELSEQQDLNLAASETDLSSTGETEDEGIGTVPSPQDPQYEPEEEESSEPDVRGSRGVLRVPANKKWTLTFNRNVDEADALVRIYVSSTPDGQGRTPADMQVRANKVFVNLWSRPIFEEGRTYYLIAEEGLRGRDGKSRLAQKVVQPFEIERSVSMPQNRPQGESLYLSGYDREDFVELIRTPDGRTFLYGRSEFQGSLSMGFVAEPNRTKAKPKLSYQLPIGEDGFFQGEIRHKNTAEPVSLPDGRYSLSIFGKKDGKYKFWRTIYLSFSGGRIFVEKPDVLGHNRSMRETFPRHWESVSLSHLYVSEVRSLEQLVAEITAGASSDYEKVRKIHDWVADNTYYDYDYFEALKSGREAKTSLKTMDILRTRVTTCSGHATLTRDLMRVAGFPTLRILGYGIGYEENEYDWSDVRDPSIMNHAWNEVFVDGRWVILDAGWDSKNIFMNGEKVYGGFRYTNFDMTEEEFSVKHRFVKIENPPQ